MNIGGLLIGGIHSAATKYLDVIGELRVNSAYTFPTSDGTSSQVLTTDGSGGVTWETSSGGASQLSDLSDVDSTVGSPSDGDIMVFRSAGADWVLEAKPAGGSNPAIADVTDITITSVADNEVLAYDSGTGEWINQTAAEAGLATAAQGALADSATQPGDNISTLTNDSGYITATLTDEEVQDKVGAMFTGNTETLITATYQDADGTIDLVVESNLASYDNGTTQFIAAGGAPVQSVNSQTGTVVLDADDIDDTSTTQKFTTASDISKLAGIEAGADVTDATNVAAAGGVLSDPTGVTGADQITNMMSLTTAEYAAIGTPDSSTLYLITDA